VALSRISKISQEAMDPFRRYSWPGNIRELQNYVERAVILTQGETLQIAPLSSRTSVSTGSTTLAEPEGDHILKALEESNWVVGGKSGTSARVGMPRTTLINKMRKRGFLCYSARSRSVHTSESTDRVINLGKSTACATQEFDCKMRSVRFASATVRHSAGNEPTSFVHPGRVS